MRSTHVIKVIPFTQSQLMINLNHKIPSQQQVFDRLDRSSSPSVLEGNKEAVALAWCWQRPFVEKSPGSLVMLLSWLDQPAPSLR